MFRGKLIGGDVSPFFKIPSAFTLPSNPSPSVSIFPVHPINTISITISIMISITISQIDVGCFF